MNDEPSGNCLLLSKVALVSPNASAFFSFPVALEPAFLRELNQEWLHLIASLAAHPSRTLTASCARLLLGCIDATPTKPQKFEISLWQAKLLFLVFCAAPLATSPCSRVSMSDAHAVSASLLCSAVFRCARSLDSPARRRALAALTVGAARQCSKRTRQTGRDARLPLCCLHMPSVILVCCPLLPAGVGQRSPPPPPLHAWPLLSSLATDGEQRDRT
jgi:hypothetical protein